MIMFINSTFNLQNISNISFSISVHMYISAYKKEALRQQNELLLAMTGHATFYRC